MKQYLTIALLVFSFQLNAQINLIDHYGNLCAAGECIVIHNQKIHVVGSLCIDIGIPPYGSSGFLARYDLAGNLEYFSTVGDTLKYYNAEELLFDSWNNQYILGNFRRDSLGQATNGGIFIQKRDSTDQILWTVEKQDSLSQVDYSLIGAEIIDNDKLVISGSYFPGNNIVSGVPEQDILFMVIDTAGIQLTQRRIGDNQSQEKGFEVISYGPNELIIASQKNFPGAQSKNWVLKVDYQGNVLDEYVSTSSLRGGVWDMVKTQDGGLACASLALNGLFPGVRAKSYVEKLDSNLNQVWEFNINYFFSDWNLTTSIDEDDNGNILVGGNYGAYEGPSDTISYNTFLLKLSGSGDSLWHRDYNYYPPDNFVQFHNLYDLIIYNDQFYFVGDANDFNNPNPPGQSMWLVSTDSNGVINSILEEKQELRVKLYPNPVKGYFIIEIQEKQESPYNLEIHDINGRLVEQRKLTQTINLIETLNWSRGLFIYRLSNSEGEIRGKIIVD